MLTVVMCINFLFLFIRSSLFSLLSFSFRFSPLCYSLFALLCSLSLSLKSTALCSTLSLWSAVVQFVEVIVWGRHRFEGLWLWVCGLRLWWCGFVFWVVCHGIRWCGFGFAGVGVGLPAWVWWVWVVAMGFGGVGLGLPAWVVVGLGLPTWVSWVWVGRRGCGFAGMGLRLAWERETERGEFLKKKKMLFKKIIRLF